jgi:hypothetical protein
VLRESGDHASATLAICPIYASHSAAVVCCFIHEMRCDAAVFGCARSAEKCCGAAELGWARRAPQERPPCAHDFAVAPSRLPHGLDWRWYGTWLHRFTGRSGLVGIELLR